MAKKSARKRRTGFGAIAHGPKSAAAKYRTEKAEAEETFPAIKQQLDAIKERFKENRASGRYGYQKSLLEIYSLVWSWEKKRKYGKARQATIARLRGVPRRDNANLFSVIVAYCSDLGERTKKEHDRDRKTTSRWSRQLDDAFEQETSPDGLIEFLSEEVASKAKKSKAKKAKVKKPKAKKYYWGPKPA